jgi:hypothetical protein
MDEVIDQKSLLLAAASTCTLVAEDAPLGAVRLYPSQHSGAAAEIDTKFDWIIAIRFTAWTQELAGCAPAIREGMQA